MATQTTSPNKTNIYVPGSSVKQRETSFGTCFKISFKAEALKAFIAEHTNANGYINLDMVPRREPSEYGDTHSLKLDSWTPTKPGSTTPPKAAAKAKTAPRQPAADVDPLAANTPAAPDDDIPF